MKLEKLDIGSPPEEVNAVIEIMAHSFPVKYELNTDSHVMEVDRILYTPMHYPCNYGFIPHTLSDDGDPADILVYCSQPIMPGAFIKVRPIGVLITEDEKGIDEKLLSVPSRKVDPKLTEIKNYNDLPKNLLDQIEYFFTHYKDLEEEKWTKVQGWQGKDYAKDKILKAIKRYTEK